MNPCSICGSEVFAVSYRPRIMGPGFWQVYCLNQHPITPPEEIVLVFDVPEVKRNREGRNVAFPRF